MAYKRAEIPELDKLIQFGAKKFVRYDEGAKMFSMGLHSFQEVAREAGAVYRRGRIVLVNVKLVEEYMENFREA